MANSILTSDNNHLLILSNGISVDKDLLKHSSIKKELEKERKTNKVVSNSSVLTNPDTLIFDGEEGEDLLIVSGSFESDDRIKKLKDYELIKDSDIHQVNLLISKSLSNDLMSHFNEYSTPFDSNSIVWTNNTTWTDNDSSDNKKEVKPKEKSLFRKLFDVIGKTIKESKTEEEPYVFNVLDFFSNVKGITKENVNSYTNRLVGYIVALKNCETTGQTALKEKLLRDMIINKYESVLYANNLYYVITESQIVDFVKKTEKGVQLTYIKNYLRSIPVEVVEKINEVNKLEIFDNYAILHYDPDSKSYAETIAETKKRRDPILFGLIKGSNKLYYITDWIDEYCDLTLDKFVETLQIEKDTLKMKETI